MVYSPTQDWLSNTYWYMRQNNVNAVAFPFAAITRAPDILKVDSGNGLRPWDVDWFNKITGYMPGTTPTTVNTVRVRRLTFGYYWNIWDGTFIGSERLIDRIIMEGMKGPKRVDYFSNVLGINSRVTFALSIPKRVRVPTEQELIQGQGAVFGVSCPIAVEGIIGTAESKPYILDQSLILDQPPTPNPTDSQSADLSNPQNFITIFDATQHSDGSLTVNTTP